MSEVGRVLAWTQLVIKAKKNYIDPTSMSHPARSNRLVFIQVHLVQENRVSQVRQSPTHF